MKKQLLAAGMGSVAAVSMTLVTPGTAEGQGAMDVSGEPYYRAVALLRSQGFKGVFGGSVGKDVPQNQCIVSSKKYLTFGRFSLMLDCTQEAQPEPVAGAPRVGSNGVTTVTATPVAPRPAPQPPPG